MEKYKATGTTVEYKGGICYDNLASDEQARLIAKAANLFLKKQRRDHKGWDELQDFMIANNMLL
jgi:hypothetical protein